MKLNFNRSSVQLFAAGLMTVLPLQCVAAAEPTKGPEPFAPKVTVGLIETIKYIDNLFATRVAKTSDGVAVTSPSLNIALENESTTLNLGGVAEFGNHFSNTSEDYIDYRVYATGRHRFNPNVLATG